MGIAYHAGSRVPGPRCTAAGLQELMRRIRTPLDRGAHPLPRPWRTPTWPSSGGSMRQVNAVLAIAHRDFMKLLRDPARFVSSLISPAAADRGSGRFASIELRRQPGHQPDRVLLHRRAGSVTVHVGRQWGDLGDCRPGGGLQPGDVRHPDLPLLDHPGQGARRDPGGAPPGAGPYRLRPAARHQDERPAAGAPAGGAWRSVSSVRLSACWCSPACATSARPIRSFPSCSSRSSSWPARSARSTTSPPAWTSSRTSRPCVTRST